MATHISPGFYVKKYFPNLEYDRNLDDHTLLCYSEQEGLVVIKMVRSDLIEKASDFEQKMLRISNTFNIR